MHRRIWIHARLATPIPSLRNSTLCAVLAAGLMFGCGGGGSSGSDDDDDEGPGGTLYVAHLFEPTFADGFIERVKVDGSGRREISNVGGGLRGMVVDRVGDRIFYTNVNDDVIISRDRSPGGVETPIVDTDLQFPQDLEISPSTSQLFWADNTTNDIQKAGFGGTGRESVVAVGSSTSIAVDDVNQRVYSEDRSTASRGSIFSVDFDGNDFDEVIDDVPTASSIAVDPVDEVIYWTSSAGLANGDGGVYRVNFDGSGFEEIFVEVGKDTGGLALDLENGFIYFGLRVVNDADIYRMELDGSNPELVSGGYGNITELVFVAP